MFFFKARRAPKPTFSTPLAPDVPFFAIGDIHGRADLLSRLLPKLENLAPASDTPVVFVGDYVDRGEESRQVLQLLHTVQQNAPGQVICLKGNHEEMMLNFLAAPEKAGPRWMRHGGLQTMASCAVASPAQTASESEWKAARDKLANALGEELISWVANLPYMWRSGNVAVVHAGADPRRAIDNQDQAVLTWGHPDFETTPRLDGTWVAHGHTIQDRAETRDGRIGLDTGAYATGLLSAGLIEPGAFTAITA